MSFNKIFDQLFQFEGKERLFPTGIKRLDQFLDGGFTPELVVVSGRYNHGKSTFLHNLMLNFSYYQEFRGMLVSPHSSPKSLARRLLSILEDQEIEKLSEEVVLDRLSDIKSMLGSRVQVSHEATRLEDLLEKAKSWKADYLIIDDFFQLLEYNWFSQKFLVENLRMLQLFVKEEQVPVFISLDAMSSAEKRYGEQIPRLIDVFKSDIVATFANKIILTYRANQVGITIGYDGGDTQNRIDLSVVRNTSGRSGFVGLSYSDYGKIS